MFAVQPARCVVFTNLEMLCYFEGELGAVQLVVGLSGRAGDSLPFVLIAAKDDLYMSQYKWTLA
jgi:hypothetical protein